MSRIPHYTIWSGCLFVRSVVQKLHRTEKTLVFLTSSSNCEFFSSPISLYHITEVLLESPVPTDRRISMKTSLPSVWPTISLHLSEYPGSSVRPLVEGLSHCYHCRLVVLIVRSRTKFLSNSFYLTVLEVDRTRTIWKLFEVKWTFWVIPCLLHNYIKHPKNNFRPFWICICFYLSHHTPWEYKNSGSKLLIPVLQNFYSNLYC